MKISRCVILGFILLCFAQTGFAREKATFLYRIITLRGERGKLQYTVESLDAGFRIVSFRSGGNEGVREDFELLVSKTWEPLFSRRWIRTPKGEMLLETRYGKKTIELQLQTPWGGKRAQLRSCSPVFDVEEVPFLLGFFWKKITGRECLSVFIPVSGMFWKGKIEARKGGEKTVFRLVLAGEEIILHYDKTSIMPREIHFPQRGYVLLLQEITPHEQNPGSQSDPHRGED